MSGEDPGDKVPVMSSPLSVDHRCHGAGVHYRHSPGCNPIWFLRWPASIDDIRWALALRIPPLSCPCMEISWWVKESVINVRRHSRRPCCPFPRYRKTS